MSVFCAFFLTFIAGMCTSLGGLISLFTHRKNPEILSLGLGFSGGVMVFLAFMELLPEAFLLHESKCMIYSMFFAGILMTALIDKLVPHTSNPHDVHTDKEAQDFKQYQHHAKKLFRVGVFTTCALFLHNFPEGMATFVSALKSQTAGLTMTLAVALHNIPEGMAIFLPVFYATGSKKKAFMYTTFSGLAEPFGALMGYLVFAPFITDIFLGNLYAVIAGMMIYLTFDELLPTAQAYGKSHTVLVGLFLGMLFMAFIL